MSLLLDKCHPQQHQKLPKRNPKSSKNVHQNPCLGDPGSGQSSYLEIWIITHLFGSCRVDHKFRALHSNGSLKTPNSCQPKPKQPPKKLARKITSCLQWLILFQENLAKVSLEKLLANHQYWTRLNPTKLSDQAFWPPSPQVIEFTSAMLVVSTILRTPAGAGSKISCCCCGVTWACGMLFSYSDFQKSPGKTQRS